MSEKEQEIGCPACDNTQHDMNVALTCDECGGDIYFCDEYCHEQFIAECPHDAERVIAERDVLRLELAAVQLERDILQASVRVLERQARTSRGSE